MTDVKLPIEEGETIVDETSIVPEVEFELPSPDPEEPDGEPRPDIPDVLSILPLRDSVIYPMLIAPLSVARDSSVQLIDEAVGGQTRGIGVVAQLQPGEDNPGFDDVYDHGCAVIIRTLVKMPDATRLIVQ